MPKSQDKQLERIVWISPCQRVTLIRDDCIRAMRSLPKNRFDAVVTDPPYGLSFMGKNWDKGVPNFIFWKACLEVAKPGANFLAFGGTRLFHRLSLNIERAGWNLRDVLAWIYGSGFPKAHSIPTPGFDGFGTALKPSWEPIVWSMKELDGTYEENSLLHGVAGLNIDQCRVGTEEMEWKKRGESKSYAKTTSVDREGEVNVGRWPANLIHDGSEEALSVFPETKASKKETTVQNQSRSNSKCYGKFSNEKTVVQGYGDEGTASRFFYCAKASSKERGEFNDHPTVKPISLMKYLCQLVKTPTGGEVLDPFCGSGSTGVACLLNGQRFVGIEKDPKSFEIAKKRLKSTLEQISKEKKKDGES